MLFNSQLFVFVFLPAVLALYYAAAERRRLRQLVVITASLAFYAYWDVRFVPLLVGLTLANWMVAQAFGRWRWPGLPLLGVAMNLAVLGVCKYANFFTANLDWLLGHPFTPWNIILPLGISFFVFQKISYLMDLKRGDRHIYGLLDFFMFVTFFPQLIAGPIVRHNEIIGQFREDPRRPEMWENLSRGFLLFLIGLTKKAAIADTMAMICDPLFQQAAAGAALNAKQAWAAAGTYTLQIYFDFSGYSDMAIGLALMFGLRLPINFDAPYRSASIQEFWRRWHMTLSRFLRDYLYIPLGGNRRGAVRQVYNLMVTMLLAGLWHGANWTFVAWGGLHGLGLAGHAVWRRAGRQLPFPAGWVLTMLFVVAGWVLFRSPDFATAGRVLTGMAGANGIGQMKLHYAAVVVLATLIAIFGPTSQDAALRRAFPAPWIAVPAGAALVYVLMLIGGRVPNEFIYFQF